MKAANTLTDIRNQVKSNIGKEVIVKADKGRNKIITRKGTIEDAFSSLFTIRIINDYDAERTLSYTYSDVLTSTVKLQIC